MKLRILSYTKKRKKINKLKSCLGIRIYDFGKNGKKLRHDLAITIIE